MSEYTQQLDSIFELYKTRMLTVESLPPCLMSYRNKLIIAIEDDYAKDKAKALKEKLKQEQQLLYEANKKKLIEEANNLKREAQVVLFKQFINEIFIVEEDAGPVSRKEFCQLLTAWKKTSGNLYKLDLETSLKLLREIPQVKYSNRRNIEDTFWGIKVFQD